VQVTSQADLFFFLNSLRKKIVVTNERVDAALVSFLRDFHILVQRRIAHRNAARHFRKTLFLFHFFANEGSFRNIIISHSFLPPFLIPLFWKTNLKAKTEQGMFFSSLSATAKKSKKKKKKKKFAALKPKFLQHKNSSTARARTRTTRSKKQKKKFFVKRSKKEAFLLLLLLL
jgi:hypothetical protein